MKPRQLIFEIAQNLEEVSDNPELEARWIVENIYSKSHLDLVLMSKLPMSDENKMQISEIVSRRKKTEPLAYILGEKEFYGIKYRVRPGVLIPRPDTECLVKWGLEELSRLKTYYESQRSLPWPFKVADWGAGSGCIGLTIAKLNPNTQVTCIEAARDAFEVLKENTLNLGISKQALLINENVESLSNTNKDQFHLILANPPYLAKNDPRIEGHVVKYEPHQALFASDEGLEKFKSWARKLPDKLMPEGSMIFEVGDGQAPEVKKILEKTSLFKEIGVIKDLSSKDRAVYGRKV